MSTSKTKLVTSRSSPPVSDFSSASSKTKKGMKGSKVTGSDSRERDSDSDNYLVDHLVDKKVVNGVPHYLVKWIGWEHSENTWEPVDHLKECIWIVDKYEKELAGDQHNLTDASDNGSRNTNPSVSSTFNKEATAEKTAKRPKNKKKSVEPSQPSSLEQALTEELSDDDFSEVDIYDGVLHECPRGKRIEKIHAVAVVNGVLQFLVQWKQTTTNCEEVPGTSKTAGAGLSNIPPVSDTNCNIVAAACLNLKFPQEVIKFYSQRIKFSDSLDTEIEERKKAAAAVKMAQSRMLGSQRHKFDPDSDSDFSGDDLATNAIEGARLKYDKFHVSEAEFMNLSSSDSDQDVVCVVTDDDDNDDEEHSN